MIRVSIPEWNLNHIQVLASDDRSLWRAVEFEVILRFNQEVNLVKVEGVAFLSSVLNDPPFDRALRGHNVRRSVGIEDVFVLSLHGHKEGIHRVDFVEEYRTLHTNRLASQAREASLIPVHRHVGNESVAVWYG